MLTRYSINIDGGCSPNPGKGAWSFVVHKYGDIFGWASGKIDYTTSNCAEYTAFIKALEYAVNNNIKTIQIITDSLLLERQINGYFLIKTKTIKDLHTKAVDIIIKNHLKVKLVHVPRSENRIADKLINWKMDRIDFVKIKELSGIVNNVVVV